MPVNPLGTHSRLRHKSFCRCQSAFLHMPIIAQLPPYHYSTLPFPLRALINIVGPARTRGAKLNTALSMSARGEEASDSCCGGGSVFVIIAAGGLW